MLKWQKNVKTLNMTTSEAFPCYPIKSKPLLSTNSIFRRHNICPDLFHRRGIRYFYGAVATCLLQIMIPTWVCPAISTPASRNSSKSSLNFPEATASWLLVPREEWTTSPAEWLSSAAVWFSSLWASWKDLLQGGSWRHTGKTQV